MEGLKIIATIVVKESFKDEMIQILHKVVDETRKESGVISYDLHQDQKDPLKFVILEFWKSQADIDMHNETAHFKEFISAIDGKVENISIDIIKKVY